MFVLVLFSLISVLFLELLARDTDKRIEEDIDNETTKEQVSDRIIVSDISQCEIEFIGYDTVELTDEDMLSIVELNKENIGNAFIDLFKGSIVKCNIVDLAKYICVNVLHVAYEKGNRCYLEAKYYTN